MIGAALYLIRRSLVNATRRRVARLRQPKYLVGFVVGCLYVYWWIFRQRRSTGFGAADSPGAELLAVGLLALVVALNWIFGKAETPFNFTLAETQYLFTAPLTRRQVIDFKLLRSQLPLFISAAVSALLFSAGQLNGLRLFRVVGLWLVYGTLQLHFAGVSLLRASLAQHGVTGLRRRMGTLLVLGGVLVLGWWSLRRELPVLVAAFQRDPGAGYAALTSALHSGLLGVLAWPLEALVGPCLAVGPVAFASQLPAALLVLAVHYLWVVRSALAFEEASVEHAAKAARRIEALRRGRGALGPTIRTPRASGAIRLRLAPTGLPSVAILWKNAVGATRDSGPRALVLVTGLVIVGSVALARGSIEGLDILAVTLLAFGGVALLFGPLAVRFDLRQDLEMLDVLKSYPVRGRQVVAGEVAAPVTVIGLVVWGCLLGAFAASAGRQGRGAGLLPLGDRCAILIALLPATAAVLYVLVVVQNAAVLLFPAWVSVGRDRAVGLEATGQRILLTAGSMVALLIALVPAIIVGGIGGAAAYAVGLREAWAVAVGAVVGSSVVAFEGALAVHLLGGVFDRLEPADTGIN
ncbi:MAG TPA: putative ABC exporter domain-containing protein [Gemmatimonadales bacterium]|nr:putative ABC exporter domain-containing protein [Gemmatimonadales bacterium]